MALRFFIRAVNLIFLVLIVAFAAVFFSSTVVVLFRQGLTQPYYVMSFVAVIILFSGLLAGRTVYRQVWPQARSWNKSAIDQHAFLQAIFTAIVIVHMLHYPLFAPAVAWVYLLALLLKPGFKKLLEWSLKTTGHYPLIDRKA